jgi:hypothetical protein
MYRVLWALYMVLCAASAAAALLAHSASTPSLCDCQFANAINASRQGMPRNAHAAFHASPSCNDCVLLILLQKAATAAAAGQPTDRAQHHQFSACLMVSHLSCTVLCSELHQLLQLANLLDEHSATTSSLALSFELWHNTQTAELLATLISQHGAKLAGLCVDFRACAADLSGGLRAGSIQAAEAAEQMLAEALQQAAEDAAAHATGGWVQM